MTWRVVRVPTWAAITFQGACGKRSSAERYRACSSSVHSLELRGVEEDDEVLAMVVEGGETLGVQIGK
jgi:hypothetical protein